MLGWTFLVSTVQDYENNAKSIASWTAGPFATAWLDRLVAEGKAEVNSFDGYPDAYKVCAKHVLPVLLSGKIPDSEGPCVLSDDNYFDEQPSMQMTLNKVVMEALNEDDLLVIEAWDQS